MLSVLEAAPRARVKPTVESSHVQDGPGEDA